MSDASHVLPASPGPVTDFKVRVLLVDDQLIIVEAIRRMLAGQVDIEFHYVTDATYAEVRAEEIAPTVILQDLVIVLSAKEDPKLKAHGFEVGANDYMVKLPDQLELLARLRYHAAGYISRLQRDEAFTLLRESRQQLADANLELEKLAALDGLTGIANRRRFDEALLHEWQRGQREQKPLALLMCDLDCFKKYNDANGHQAGDMCLQKAAAIMREHLKRPADLAARYGGEEFAIILPATELDGALALANACRAHLESLALGHSGNESGMVTMSIGVAQMLPSAAFGPEELIARADKALYKAKNGGRNRVCLSDENG